VFDGLDSDAPPVPARMLVELPFRLMCENAIYDVTLGLRCAMSPGSELDRYVRYNRHGRCDYTTLSP
jgi:hypothetical protein